MSDGPIKLIQPSDLEFVPVPTDFSGILSDNLGNLGTDSDGFDQYLSDTIDLVSEAGTVLDTLDDLLNTAATVVPLFATTAPADLAASLQSASSAADTVLHDFTQSIAPAPDQGTVTPTAPAQPYTPPTNATIITLPTMQVGDTAASIPIDSEQRVTGDPQCVRVVLNHGDTTIFRAGSVSTRTPNIGAGSQSINTNWYLTVTPTKAGTFYAEVDDQDQCNSGNDALSYYKVTIIQKQRKVPIVVTS